MSKNIKNNTAATNNIDDIPMNSLNLEVTDKIITKTQDDFIDKVVKTVVDTVKKKQVDNKNQVISSVKPKRTNITTTSTILTISKRENLSSFSTN